MPGSMPAGLTRRSRAGLRERLEDRLPEIEQAILTRAHALADPAGAEDPAYVEGLRAAVSAGLRYGFSGIDGGGGRSEPVPPELVSQARLAARNGVSLDTVLRRYFAGYTLFSDFIMQEARRVPLDGEESHRLLRAQGELFDRLIVVVSEEHTREADSKARTGHQRKAECVERLLAGALADTAGLNYDFDGWHLGAVAKGLNTDRSIDELARALDRHLLKVPRDDGIAWIWLGGRNKLPPAELRDQASSLWPEGASLAIGESARNLAGWRLTHRQAIAALSFATGNPQKPTYYPDIALLASMMQDDLLIASLHERYLVPLAATRSSVRHTLRAYFEANRNVSSTAAALGVSRNTVASRLQTVEASIGCALTSCASDVEAALRLEEAKSTPPAPS